jgi:NAD+ synthase (glutamine-hydrolysing)
MLTVTSVGFDLRPFLYPSRFPWQFKKIDEIAAVLPDRSISIVMEKAKKQD